jgi:hypothetical protein
MSNDNMAIGSNLLFFRSQSCSLPLLSCFIEPKSLLYGCKSFWKRKVSRGVTYIEKNFPGSILQLCALVSQYASDLGFSFTVI